MNLTELFSPEAVSAAFIEDPSNKQPFLGAGLFPERKKAGLDLSWIKGTRGLPISLKPSNFDAKATFRDRIGVSKIETEMPFFREGYHINEKDRQEILKAQDSNSPFVQAVLDNIYHDIDDLVAGAYVVPERMRMQLLAPDSGNVGIHISANGVDYTYNYDPDGSWKGSNYVPIADPTKLWNVAATATPITDIEAVQDTIENATGSRPNTAIMSRATFNMLMASKQVHDAILAQNPVANIFITPSIVKQAFSQILGVSIIVYTKKFRDESKAVHAYYPDKYVTLFDSGVSLGSTYYGTTPEEADLMGKSTPQAKTSLVGTGIAVTQILQPHPVNLETIASEIVLPSYEGMNTVGVMKVA